ncbi:hypothetical protein [Vreelandella indica]|uniref:hypothetical protein n=1 Tax=Vreelandella indica TaxID=3126500 RepID=UPI00300E5006
MVIKDIIKSPAKIRLYFITLAAFLALLIIANYYLLPKAFVYFGGVYEGAVLSFFNNMIALLGSSLLASGFFWFVTPSGLDSSDVNVIAPHDVKNILNSMLDKTERFYYYGHTARWNRAVAFPKILETANDSRTTKYIEALIIDPDSEDACKFYASFGHANRVKGRNIRSVRDVRLELLTTTLVCLRINSSPFINFELSVTNKVAISRLDISDSALIMTKPYPGDPALHFPKDTFFYASYKEEFNIAKQQGRKINMEASKIDISSENIKEILFEAGFDVSYFDVDFERDLLHALNNIEKPY